MLGAQEVIQTAVLQFKEAKGDRYAYGMHVYAYPLAAAWQEGIGTTAGASGSTGFPWGPASIGDAVYLYSQVTQVGPAEQYPELASAGWTGYIVATNGVPWTVTGGQGVGSDVLNRPMIDQDWTKAVDAARGAVLRWLR